MTALRVAIAVLAVIAGVAGLFIPQPEVFAISGSAAMLIFLLGCGSIAADALPLRVVPLVCSVATVPLAVLLVRPFSVSVLAFAILGLQLVGWRGGRVVRSVLARRSITA